MSTREVTLDGGSPWGFRMHGGHDQQHPLRIARVNPGSKAAQRGIREGDFISSINGQSTRGITNSEAHALLKNSGDTLVLGLNQESTGSPKRRTQKISQESKDENSKGTCVTSSSTTINYSEQNIESTHTNGVGDYKETVEDKSESNNFTSYIKNGSPYTTPHGATGSQPRDVADDGTARNHPTGCNECGGDNSVISTARDKTYPATAIMADNVCGSSRSRNRRKTRSQRKKIKKCNAQQNENSESSTVETITGSSASVISEDSDYKVEFPASAPVEMKSANIQKSRSLDDDDQLKIVELTDEEKTAAATISESTAIVSEAESDVEWETVAELAVKKKTSEQQFGKMSIISLPLEEHVTYETTHISPEDERSLRHFLEGLDLVNSPEESVKRIDKTSAAETLKMKKAKKRAALAQHFLPYYQNPRFLDVISEEGSDLSDRDNKQSISYTRHLLTNDDEDDDDDDNVFEDVEKKLQNKFQSYYAGKNENAILVGTRLIDQQNSALKEATWSTSIAETPSGAEIVYLEDSSNSMTPSDLLEQEETTGELDADDEEDISIDLDKSLSDPNLNSSETSLLIKSDNSVTTLADTASRASVPSDSEQIKSQSAHQPTPPPNQSEPTNDTDKKTETSNSEAIDFQHQNAVNVSKNTPDDALIPLHVEELHKLHENHEFENSIKQTPVEADKLLENEEELNKEMRNLYDGLNNPNDECVNEVEAAANASRSNSVSSAHSSSTRSTSQCTTVYNPVHSSLTNIAAALREGSFDDDKICPEPAPLREICVQALLAMPYGKDVIEELANISQRIEEMTCETPSHTDSIRNKSSLLAPIEKPSTDVSSVLLVDNSVVQKTSSNPMSVENERWTGMPTEENPNLLICLSPSQKEFIDKTKTFPNEADSLLDLHRKYFERRGYHEGHEYSFRTSLNKETPKMPTFKIKIEQQNNNIDRKYKTMPHNINYSDYVKQFTHEIPVQILKSNVSEIDANVKNGNLRYDKYIKTVIREVPIQVEKQTNKPVNNKIYGSAMSAEGETVCDKRLKARHLGEWLNLARSECDRINNTRKVQTLHSSVNKLVKQRSCDGRFANSSETTFGRDSSPRRYSLPFNLYEQQMQYILKKEREIECEIEQLKSEKSKLENGERVHIIPVQQARQFDAANYQISRKGDIAILSNANAERLWAAQAQSNAETESEKFRQEMYNEYMSKIAERQQRKHNKVIKIQISPKPKAEENQSLMSPQYEVKHVSGIEDEFMNKVREKKNKLGIEESDRDDEKGEDRRHSPPVQIIDGSSLATPAQIPKHLQEFIDYTAMSSDDGVWSPGKSVEPVISEVTSKRKASPPKDLKCDEPIPVVWTPRSAGSSPTSERKEFRPVNFESPVLGRKNISKESTPVTTPDSVIPIPPPWQGAPNVANTQHCQQQEVSSSTTSLSTSLERKLTTSHSAPIAGLNSLGKLPRAQNPTITLLQKAREGQLPRGALYIEDTQQKVRSNDGRPPLIGPGEILYTVKNEYLSESDSEKPKKMADLGPRKFEGIGPTTKDGMPIVLRSIYDYHQQEVKDSHQAKWYKRMYDTLHRARNDDEYVTVRYKTRRGRYPYTSAGGYLSEPEPNAYDSDAGISASKYATLDRRRIQTNQDKENEYVTYTVPRNKYMSSASVKYNTDVYKNQPGRIENYIPGHSSISEKEAKEWWDEVMEIFDGHLEQQKHVPPTSRSYMSQALKESGYESDSTLVFRRRKDAALQLSPHEQKEAYKSIQKGGEVPLHGLRKPAPERPKDDSDIEYFPISPTLTRIRVHKKVKPVNEVLCYPVTVHHQPFSIYKRTAPSSSIPPPPQPPLPKLPIKPPSPPKRKSSRNSHTLRLVSTMTIHSPKSSRRHETCFRTPGSNSNVKFLRDRISCKLKSPLNTRKNVKVTKTISTYPSGSKESISTIKTSPNTLKSRADVSCKKDASHHHFSRNAASSTAKRCCRHCSFSVPPKISSDTTNKYEVTKPRSVSLERTFGTEKRKVDLILPKPPETRYKLVKSPELLSPSEVKKTIQKQKDNTYPPGTTIKKSTSLFSSAKNGSNKASLKSNAKSLNVTVAYSSRGKELLRSPSPKTAISTAKSSSPTLTRVTRTNTSSPVPSNISDRSKASNKSTESLQSASARKKTILGKPLTISRIKLPQISNKDELNNKKKNKKVKKDQSNEELKKEKKSQKIKDSKIKSYDANKIKKCVGRATGTGIAKELKKMETVEPRPRIIQPELIEKQQKDIFQSDTFFQHLFLRDFMSSPTPSVASKSSYILERTKMLENNYAPPPIYAEPTIGALKVYLSHRKPVTESKFKTLDREMVRSRSVSPCGLSRSFSDHYNKFDSISEVSNEDLYYYDKYGSQESVRNRRSTSLPAKIILTETSRPISPSVERRSPSTSPIRSPSRRKIHSIKPHASITVEGISGIKKRPIRARSAGEAEALKREIEKPLSPSVSSISLSHTPQDYKTYVTELRHSSRKSDRFKELNRFYSSLERLSQLERTTSSTDLRPRRKFEDEIIDYDRWMQVRTRERAEQEFNTLYKKLKQDQKEKDLLFKPKDVEQFKWKSDRDFNLKIKEKSVENIKEQFEKLKLLESPLEISKRRTLNYQKDTYKPLWRGNSVLNLVSKISEKRSQSESRADSIAKQQLLTAERLLSREIGNKLWSSLSIDQVNTLKHQLAEIYSQGPPAPKKEDYSINVEPNTKIERPKSLIIRRNSANELTSEKQNVKKDDYKKSCSIGSIAASSALSESEKKRLSQSLSREVQNRMSQKRKYKSSLSIVLGKETRGAIAAAEAKIIQPPESTSPRTCYSLEPTEDDANTKTKAEKDFLLVLTKDESEDQKENVRQTLNKWAQPKSDQNKQITPSNKISSTSETESASSDTSTKTAIFVGKKDELHKKIEYFERGTDETYVPTIYKPAEDDVDSSIAEAEIKSEVQTEKRKKPAKLTTSQSYADLKELFGEKELMKFATIPLSATKRQSTTPRRPLLRATNISPIRTISEASSRDSLRSRSISPDTERFWNAYLALVRGVDVRKLTEKFELLKDFYSNRTVRGINRRCKSDPELTSLQQQKNEFGDVYWLKKRYENLSRSRSRVRRHGKTSPIPKATLKADDRLMPHINIISKLASLYPKRSLSSEEKTRSMEDLAKALGCPLGEVEKLREKFESPDRKVSLLGHMFTSSPNIHELRDIAPYLAGSWIAHQYPRFQDNSRSASFPEKNGANRPLIRRDHPRPKSASPPRSSKPPPSILKPHLQQQPKDIFANQFYDPSIHRPICRYRPISPKTDRSRSWSPVAKHTVTFKEPILGPTPPPKGQHSFRDTGPESPRKYVEDEVTIHYRSPVRHEIKEALSEEELARRQAEAMRRIYQEERRRKYLQELQDMNSRRHTDNFIPSQKSPIPLNRYDDFFDDLSPKMKVLDRSPEPRLVARALYNFVGQSSRELTFRKGDVIFIRRQVDKNWYEGEHNAMIGLFPTNYVEIVPYDGIKSTPRKANEGQARAKFNFIAQTHLELSLAKGELVVLTRRVDDNWFEGRIGNRKGIFPVSYVEILIDPSEKQEIALTSSKPVASPAAHSLLLNGSASGKESMGSHHYQPSYSSQSTATSYHAKPVNVIGTTTSSYQSITRTQKITSGPSLNEALHIDTHSEPVPYRALYKYRPQNDDELELQEGDTVYVLEKCDDGWYVGSSQRTGAFGTFPGNYVERI